MKYIPLNYKSSYNLLSSLCDIKQTIKKCLDLDIKAIAITDPNMYGTMEFYKECKKHNIKPILGLELELNNSKILLYAKNYEGYQNLTRLTYLKQNKILEIEDLKKHSKNLILITKEEKIFNIIKDFYENSFIGYSTIEEKQKISITEKIFINEILFLEKKDSKYLKYLLSIKDNKKETKIDEYNINENSYFEYFIEDFKTQKKVCEMCNVEFNFNKNLLPKYDLKEYNAKDYLFELCKKGLSKRLNNKVTNNYYERLKKELKIIDQMGFNDYFLIVWDFIKYSKKNNILIGSGRGSAAGSLVAYSLGITEVDPIKYNLFFERFLNPQRITLPDIDIDFESNKRNEVVEYVINKYSNKKVVLIITFSTLTGKQVIRDVGRTLNIQNKHLDTISKCLSINKTLKESLQENKKLYNYINENKLQKLFEVSLKLEGMKRQISTHAAGVIISNLELDSYIPLEKYDNHLLSGFSMEHLEELGLLKFDFLGLKNLTLIDNVIKDINDKNLNFNNIPLEDKKTLEIFKTATTEGIFQFESEGMKEFLKKLNPSSFEDIVAAIALFRPGPAANIDNYIRRKNQLEKVNYLHDDLKEILKSTYGIIIYQEQIMQIAQTIAGYSLAEADVLRRAMSKKNKESLEEEREKFLNQANQRNYDKKTALEIFELILKFANYGFNKSHSVAYSMISFKMAYLKVHYKNYFMANLLTNSIGNETKTKEYIDESRKLQIDILKPSINKSDYKNVVENNKIRLALSVIKNLGTVTCKEIVKERKKGYFLDFFDFVARTYKNGINKKTLESLIDADCFKEFKLNHKTLYENIDLAINYAELANSLDSSLIEKPNIKIYDEYDEEDLIKKELEVYGFYLSIHPVVKYKTNYNNFVEIKDVKNYFDKNVNMILYIENIKEITTKNNKKMFFIKASDEYGKIDVTCFPNMYDDVVNLKPKDIININGKVEKRMSTYQIIAFKIEKKTKI